MAAYVEQERTAEEPWRREPGIAGLIGKANILMFEKVLYPFGVRGATTVGRFLLGDRPVVFRRPDGAAFTFPAADSYYGYYLYHKRRPYEPDIAFLLERSGMAHLVDCGANFGYWSCSARQLPGKIVAIELSPRNYAWLARNAALNDNRFVAINAAAWSEDGKFFEVTEGVRSHAGQSGRPGASGVGSRSIDSIVAEFGLEPSQTIVKVDCEGMELEVLAGARCTAEAGGLFVVEEHGNDLECKIARQMEADGWLLHRWEGGWRPTDVPGIAALKTNPRNGYNVLAHHPGVRLPPALLGQ